MTNNNHNNQAIEITANTANLSDTSNMIDNNKGTNMTNLIGYTSLIGYIALAGYNPTIALFVGITVLVVSYMLTLNAKLNQERAIALESLRAWSESLRENTDDEDHTEEVTEIADPWDGYVPQLIDELDVDSAIASVDYQLCLPMAREQVRVIDYSTYTYRQLQAMVKEARVRKSDIKLNAKKSALIAYLQTV